MAFLDFFRAKRALPTVDTVKPRGINFIIREGQIEYYSADIESYINKGFRSNVDVYKIVSDLAARRSENPLELAKVKDKKSLSKFYAKAKQPHADMFGVRSLQVKAFGDSVEKHEVLTLLNKPNLYQSGDEFEAMASIWYDLLGEAVIWVQRQTDNPKSKPVALHVLPPFDVGVVADGNFRGVKSYVITSLNKPVPKEDLLLITRPNAKTTDMYGPMRGLSPLEPGLKVLQRSNESDTAAVDILQSKGALGAVYVDDPNVFMGQDENDTKEDATERHESNFVKKMYGKFAKNRIFFSNAKLGYVDFGKSSADIGIAEHDKAATSKLCRLFNYPEILLTGDIKYENLRAASKLLIVSNIMPYQAMMAEALTNWLLPQFGVNAAAMALVYDPLYYSEVQEDIKDIGSVLEDVTFLTINEKRAYLSYEPLTDELADKLLVKQGLVPLEDLALGNEPLPNADYANNQP